ncbi:MAG: phage terminase large subunit [Sphingobium sp.]|uniref:phage terminase large subunit n=1 Tax=Sphingobium sp. TaxID=1912891 RepID=UPI0029ABCC09|nr:phage terminase large subunit [Sphingobium sp.]MDX3909647.1 phage terminase large subunit [Sphingobium sp.]
MNPSESRQLLRLALREDLSTFIHRTFREVSPGGEFVHAWYVDAIAHVLTLCAQRKITRLIINMPPRYGKSICTSVAFAAWILGRNPKERIICASYGDELSGEFARDTRKVLQAPWYQSAFPSARIGKRAAAHDVRTTMGGGRYATSVGGTLTGIGGSIIIVDDPNKAEDATSEAGRERVREWFRSTLITRLNDRSTGVIIIVQQRLHVEDLSGYLMESGEDWLQLSLPAIAEEDQKIAVGPGRTYHRPVGELLHPQRDTIEALMAQKRAMGSHPFSAQYQQEPVPLDGEIVKWGWFQTYDDAPFLKADHKYVQSWDTAMKSGELNDHSVGTTWLIQDGNFYLLDVVRLRLQFPDLKRAVIAAAQRWEPSTLLIEDKASGTSLIDVLIEEQPQCVPRPIRREPKADKITRMYAQANAIEQGRVFLPREAPWLAVLKTELLQFPNGRHDDQVDSISQFLEWA